MHQAKQNIYFCEIVYPLYCWCMKTIFSHYIHPILFLLFPLFGASTNALADNPPRVSIISPEKESTTTVRQVNINYLISESTPETVNVLIDGKLVQSVKNAVSGENEITVEVPAQDCQISVIAQNKSGKSIPAIINIYWFGPSADVRKPTLHILAVGIGQYADPTLRLQFAAKDVSDFVQTMTRQKGLLYETVETKLLTDQKATAKNIRDGLTWLRNKTGDQDIAVLYLAGHGINNKTGSFFFMPIDADFNNPDAGCIGYADIKKAVAAVAGKVIIFMDACHSGKALGDPTEANNAVKSLSETTGKTIVFASSTGRQYSLENPEWNNGAFTKAVVEGLNGKADLLGNNTVTVKTLDYYIAGRVKELTNGKQAPVTIVSEELSEITLAVVSQ